MAQYQWNPLAGPTEFGSARLTTPVVTDASPIINVGPVRLLNVPHAAAVAREVWDDDCYRLSEIPDGSVVIDAGAFYGEFGLICHIAKNCDVIALEPAPLNLEIARLNVRLNIMGRGFLLLAAALGSATGERILKYRFDHPAGSLLGVYGQDVVGFKQSVSCVTMSDIIDDVRLRHGDKAKVVVKLDIEGAEREVFSDPSWLAAVSIVTMEWHNHDGDRYATILRAHGFDVDVTGGGPPPRPPWDPSIGGGLLFAKRL